MRGGSDLPVPGADVRAWRRSWPPEARESGARAPRAARGSISRSPTAEVQPPVSSLEDIAEKARTVCQGPDTKDFGDGLAEVRERGTRADIGARADHRARQEHGHVFARVIGARCGRVVSMVGRDDEQVSFMQAR